MSCCKSDNLKLEKLLAEYERCVTVAILSVDENNGWSNKVEEVKSRIISLFNSETNILESKSA